MEPEQEDLHVTHCNFNVVQNVHVISAKEQGILVITQ